MREQEIICNLEDLQFDSVTKTYSFDSTQFDIEQPESCVITDCSISFPEKHGYVFLCSDELFSRKKMQNVIWLNTSTSMGYKRNILCTLVRVCVVGHLDHVSNISTSFWAL